MSFNLKLDEIHHHEGPHPFQGIKIGMVTQFPLDYMHLVCLGVVKKMLQFWLRGPLTVRMPALIVDRMSHELQSVRPNVPVEFARRPRSLKRVRPVEGNRIPAVFTLNWPCGAGGILGPEYVF